MTQDELLMMSFVRGWTPLTTLLQNCQVHHLFTNENNTIFFLVDKKMIGPGFCYDLDQTDCVYSLGMGKLTAKFEIYP
jgi:hypothetical protein